MERTYWIGRKRAAMGMARNAAASETRLIHYQLAGLYSIKAAQTPSPFMLPRKEPATVGERLALRDPGPSHRPKPDGKWA
jgi:hypothetical protein